MFQLDGSIWFPPVRFTNPDGILAFGGDLSIERLLLAYSQGIFPWFNDDEPPIWWCPDPRFVIFPDELKVSKSMKKIIKDEIFEFKINENFEQVMHECAILKRKDQNGTWITDEFIKSYTQLHKLGYAYSAETYYNNELVGGLYGIWYNDMFCGESMFFKMSNASKFALIKLTEYLKTKNVKIIDCQIKTDHLQSLGGRYISRNDFLTFLK